MDDDTQKIFVVNRLSRYSVRVKKIQEMTATITNALGVGEHEVAIEFVGPARMRSINKQFRGKDKSTDVLSFPQHDWPKSLTASPTKRKAKMVPQGMPSPSLGDIIISLPDAQRNAHSIGQGLDREVGFLLVHGVLHLCGHDHMESGEEKLMRREQRKLMQALTARAKAPLWQACVTAKKARA